MGFGMGKGWARQGHPLSTAEILFGHTAGMRCHGHCRDTSARLLHSLRRDSRLHSDKRYVQRGDGGVASVNWVGLEGFGGGGGPEGSGGRALA